MPIDNPPIQAPNQTGILTPPDVSPFTPLWFTTQTITDIPESSVGWMLANGWVITAVSYVENTSPPQARYAMRREALQNWLVLQNLINSYTIAANDAKANNEVRYNQVVANWTEMLTTSQEYLDDQADEQNAHVALYLGNLDTYMDQIDSQVDSNRNELVLQAAFATDALETMDEKLIELESNADANATTIGTLLTNQGTYLSTFLTDFAAKLDELDTNYSSHLTNIQTLLTGAGTDLTTFTSSQTAELSTLEAAYTAHAATLDSLLLTAASNLATISDEIATILTSIASDYSDVDAEVNALLTSGTAEFTAHANDFNAVLTRLEADYALHSLVAPALLDGLGATDLARINEEFAASWAEQLQMITNRGFASSAAPVDAKARSDRDRSERISQLNDQLNREKLDNQHKLYGQQVDVRARTLDGKDRLHGVRQEILRYQASQVVGLHTLLQAMRDRTLNGKQTVHALRDANTRLNVEVQSRLYDTVQTLRRLLVEEAARLHGLEQSVRQWETGQRDRLLEQVQQIETQHLAGIDKQHAAQQDVSRIAMGERDTLYAQLRDAVDGFIAGKERYSNTRLQQASTVAEHKHRVIVEKMNEVAVRLEGQRSKHAENMELMRYMIDERNKLLVGLYGFVERREDIGPKFQDLAQVCTALGDAGGGWITP